MGVLNIVRHVNDGEITKSGIEHLRHDQYLLHVPGVQLRCVQLGEEHRPWLHEGFYDAIFALIKGTLELPIANVSLVAVFQQVPSDPGPFIGIPSSTSQKVDKLLLECCSFYQ